MKQIAWKKEKMSVKENPNWRKPRGLSLVRALRQQDLLILGQY